MEEDYIQEEDGDVFIESEDVYAEVPDDDVPGMDDDDDEAADEVGDLHNDGEDVKDNSLQHFPNHNSSVFAVSCHPTEPLAASGGEDDLGYIWDITDGEDDREADRAHRQIWRRVGKENYRTWEFLTELQGPDEVMWLRWHPKGTVLLAGSNDGTVWLWQLPSGNTMQVFAGHTGAVQCGEFTPDGKRIVTACADGTLMFWDPRSPHAIFKLTSQDTRFNLGGITSLAINSSSTLAVVGGAGSVRVVSLSKGELVGALGGHDEEESVEAMQFIDLVGTSGVIVTGGTDGKACIWDVSTMRLRATLEHQDAITTVLAHPAPKSHLIVTASADKTLKTWDVRTGTLVKEHTGHHAPILSASLGLQGSVVVSAGDDGVCLVFTTEVDEEQ
ncbi:WD40-repeat-containing domain protein [Melanogaster broomeanus]|nr:WD40-repeat-containing domain protein [Melanogaster broomeanus]